MAAAYFVGLDVHSKQTVFEIQDASGAIVATGAFPTTQAHLRRFVVQHRLAEQGRVALETGNSAFFVAGVLLDLSVDTHVIDAREVRAKASRTTQKSDTRDAHDIATGIRLDYYERRVFVPPTAIRELRDILSRRRHFVRAAAVQMVAIKRVVRAEGIAELARTSLRTERGWQRLKEGVTASRGADRKLLLRFIEQHREVWRTADAQVTALDDLLGERVAALHPEQREAIERLDRIPGFGLIVSATTFAILVDAARFPDAKHVASFAGIVPTTDQSGDRDAHGHLTRRGSIELRSMLCEAAHHACRRSHPLQPYFAKLTARRGYKIAIVAVAHRLLRIAWRMLRDRTEFDPAKLGVERGPFEHKVVREWQLKEKERPKRATSSAVAPR